MYRLTGMKGIKGMKTLTSNFKSQIPKRPDGGDGISRFMLNAYRKIQNVLLTFVILMLNFSDTVVPNLIHES
jgi:hypothetical protein